MKLLSFAHKGRNSWGVAVDSGVIDGPTLTNQRFLTLRQVLEADALPELAALAAKAKPTLAFADIEFLPVIPDPDNIFCIGLNYEDHRLEAKRDPVGQPTIFMRTRRSQAGHEQPMLLPPESTKFDYEGEIAVIIGKAGRRVSEENAWNCIAGYAPYNDGSIRDWQRHTTQWTPGKNFERTGPFGPWMTTRDEIGDGEVLTLETRLNGTVMQHATTQQLIFSIPRLIAYISSFTTLVPGDVIVTGTPGGVGMARDPQVFMKAGDTVEIEVSKVGVLKNVIVSEVESKGASPK
jgi:2-keto-4-pentenoate hydratase/2-oxohepta-3-ene-1,7-dioic acid hydratase in catechol pathway